MAPSLSELLERIRPVGTPGAPAEGEGRRLATERSRELAAVVEALLRFEAAAGSTRDEAARTAKARITAAEREASSIRSSLPERLAVGVARAEAEETSTIDAPAAEEIGRAAELEVARMNRAAAAAVPMLVGRTVDLIWALLDGEPAGTNGATGSHDGPERGPTRSAGT